MCCFACPPPAFMLCRQPACPPLASGRVPCPPFARCRLCSAVLVLLRTFRPLGGPRCAGNALGRRSLPGGSHARPSLAVAYALPSLCCFARSALWAARAVQVTGLVAARFRTGPMPALRSLSPMLCRPCVASHVPRLRRGPRCAGNRLGRRSLPDGSHAQPSLAVARAHIPKYLIWKYTRALSWSGLVSASKPITL